MINDVLFIIHFTAIIGLMLYSLYTLMYQNKDKKEAFKKDIIIFISNLLAWFFGLMVVLLEYETVLYSQFFKLTSLLFLLSVLFFIIKLFIYFATVADKTIKPFNSKV